MSHSIYPTTIQSDRDAVYLQIIFDRLNICRSYKPKFGKGGEGLDYQAFRQLYGGDVFYSWFGLDHTLMYSAHKAAGGITSVYRQIGFGSEELIRQILQDELGLTNLQSTWSYQTETSSGRRRTLKLDGRIAPDDVLDVRFCSEVVRLSMKVFRVFMPTVADKFVGTAPLRCLQPFGKVERLEECVQMKAQ